MAYPNPPNIATEPNGAAAAGCSAQAIVSDQWTDGTNWWQVYTFEATAVAGWRFVKFTWDRTEKDQDGVIVWSDTDIESPDNPTQSAVDTEEQYILLDDNPIQSLEIRIGNLTAHFEPVQYTNLLVNSAALSSPVQLVYDDRPGGSGKLVADY